MNTFIEQMREASPAFRQALLKSEKRRIIAVVGFVLFFLVLAAVRIFVLGSAMSRWGIPLAAILILWELGLFHAVGKALKGGYDLPIPVWYITLALETLFPAVGVAFLTSSRILPDYRPLATPWALAFFPFILLSVMRLSPALCSLSGIVSALGYLGAAYHSGWHFNPGPDGFSATQTAVPFFALLLLVSGIIAGAVAGEVRTHVEAALREVETRHQLQQVEHELQIARSVQQSLLPKTRPEIPGFQVAGWNRSADDTGGDFYDWQQLPNGRWVVVLADVTGHGIGPAILASVCRAYSRASFNDRDNLQTTLKNINQSFVADVTPGRFATFVAAVFQEGSDEVELFSAGHGPLFVYSAQNKSCQMLTAHVLPLGLLPDLGEGLPVKIDMKFGDIVLLITDGFAEWENKSGEQFGADRLAELVGHLSDREPEIIIAELYDAVLKFTEGTPQGDDLTAVLIKCVGKKGTLVKASAAD